MCGSKILMHTLYLFQNIKRWKDIMLGPIYRMHYWEGIKIKIKKALWQLMDLFQCELLQDRAPFLIKVL